MKELLISALFGVITHYAHNYLETNGQSANMNAHSGALTLRYGNHAAFKRATDAFLGEALAFIEGKEESVIKNVAIDGLLTIPPGNLASVTGVQITPPEFPVEIEPQAPEVPVEVVEPTLV